MLSAADPFGLVGNVVGEKYRIDRVVGEGGFGVVYAGMHLVVGQPIAVKCMRPSLGPLAEQARTAELFAREARVLFGLTHPAVVRLYDTGVIGTRFGLIAYVVLELLEGVSLAHEMTRRAQAGAPFGPFELHAIID